MTAQVVVTFENGKQVYFGGDSNRTSLTEVGVGSAANATRKEFEAALDNLGELVDSLQKAIAKTVTKPDKVELAFGASIKGKCDLWVVSGEGEADFKVTLTWGK